LADIEQETIDGAIALCGGDITQASKRLGITRATIYRKLKEWRRAARTAAPAVPD
jgi:transcriptional regulator of acetoin/glycerol metabolism